MVSKAREDLPEPDRPVNTTSRSRGISRSMFLRLCSRAPRIAITRLSGARAGRCLSNRSFIGSAGWLCADILGALHGGNRAVAEGATAWNIVRTAGLRQPEPSHGQHAGWRTAVDNAGLTVD